MIPDNQLHGVNQQHCPLTPASDDSAMDSDTGEDNSDAVGVESLDPRAEGEEGEAEAAPASTAKVCPKASLHPGLDYLGFSVDRHPS